MNICLVNTLFPPAVHGGTEAVVQLTAELLLQAGHQVSVITTQPEQPSGAVWNVETSRGYSFYRFRPSNLYYYTEGHGQPVWKKLLWHAIDIGNGRDAQILRQLLLHIRPDVVHGHNLKGMSYTLPSVCAELHLPYVHTLHNYQLLHPYGTFMLGQHPPLWEPKLAALTYQALCRRKFRRVHTVISPTRLPLDLHRQAGFFRETASLILPSPVHHEQTAPEFTSPSAVRFVYLGALERHKGILDLLEAVRKLPNEGWTLDIYGQGSLESSVTTIAKELPNIRCLGYLKDKRTLSQYDALVYPSRCYETQGLSIAEALSYGTPVIAANIGGIQDTVIHTRNGLLYTAGNVQELTSTLRQVIEQPEIVRRLRAAAFATKIADRKEYIATLLDVYRTAAQ